MNGEWHAAHPMPPKATLEQRVQWHKEHQKHCACREVPKSLAPYFKPEGLPKNTLAAPAREQRGGIGGERRTARGQSPVNP